MLALFWTFVGLWTVAASAHVGKVVRSTTVNAGPYTMEVLFYASPKVGQAIPITIAPHPITSDGQALNSRPQLQVTLQPSPGMSAREVRLRVYDDPDQPVFYAVDPIVDVGGTWIIQFDLEGEAGSGTGSTKMVVAGADGSSQAPAQTPAQTPASVPANNAPAGQGLNMTIVIPFVVGLGLLLLGGWWVIRRPATRTATPARRPRQ
jgi:hypothetical protein